jgi:hypothetical protein
VSGICTGVVYQAYSPGSAADRRKKPRLFPSDEYGIKAMLYAMGAVW